MTYNPKILEIVSKLKSFLVLPSTKVNFRVLPQDFSRASGKLDFASYCLLGVSLLKNSLACELYNLLTSNELAPISKSAYSQGRYKIKHEFYQAWTQLLLSEIANLELASKKWCGYQLEAVDGTCLVLPQTKELDKKFGSHKSGTLHGKTVETVMAKCLLRVDLLNGYVLQSEVYNNSESEIGTFKNWLWQLSKASICIMDRGFACLAIFAYLVAHQKPFVTRLRVGFSNQVKAFVASNQTDSIVEFEVTKATSFINEVSQDSVKTVADTCIEKGTKFKLRLVKILLPTAEVEVLATNLMDQALISLEDLNALYKQRWGVETIIDSLKNQLLLMVFSGIKSEAILQDIYATMFVYNLRQLLTNEAQQLVDEQIKESKRAVHAQKINQNVALGALKTKIITLFLVKDPKEIIQTLIVFFTKNKMPLAAKKVIPKREKSLAKRRNLVIQMNYKKAF